MVKDNVDDTGIEPVTPTMSMWCSTAEPIVRVLFNCGVSVTYEFKSGLSSVIILDTLNIIFSKICSTLDLNKDHDFRT